jgi:(Z)-2-((N-methylformamido)methylene)-5-hydroxybutyrolactone dehydrogenase
LIVTFQSYIGGRWRAPTGNSYFESYEPLTGAAWARIPENSLSDVSEAVEAADAALLGEWGACTPTARSRLMLKLADAIDSNVQLIANTESRDNGKVLREMMGQAQGLSGWYRYFAGLADKIEGRTVAADKAETFTFTQREPVGVVAAITAWNSPLLLLAYKLAPALAAGCTLIVKPSELASASTLRFAEIFERVGFPRGIFSVVTGGPNVGCALVSHPKVRKVTFTGSTAVGREIAKIAGAKLARVSLELGGKSANIVFDDADLDAAADGVVAGIYAAGGQTCMAGSRLLVQASIAARLLSNVAERARTIVLGDPSDLKTEMGPLISEANVNRIHQMVQSAISSGARLVAGGVVRADLGKTFYAPTILDNVTASMPIAQEELFGPVLVVQRFATMGEALALANDTRYGLAAGVWTQSLSNALNMSRRLVAGTVWINAYRAVSFSMPTSGRKESGLGIENGVEAIDEFLQTKSIWVNLSSRTRDPFKIG